jgi:antitoxin YefM
VPISASEARKNLYGLIKQVNDNVEGVEITSRNGSAFLIPADEWRSIQETAHLLRSPANATRLTEAIDDIEAGRYTERELVDPEPTPGKDVAEKAPAKKVAAPAKKAVAKKAASSKRVAAKKVSADR